METTSEPPPIPDFKSLEEEDEGSSDEFNQIMTQIALWSPFYIMSTWVTIMDNMDDAAFSLTDALDGID